MQRYDGTARYAAVLAYLLALAALLLAVLANADNYCRDRGRAYEFHMTGSRCVAAQQGK